MTLVNCRSVIEVSVGLTACNNTESLNQYFLTALGRLVSCPITLYRSQQAEGHFQRTASLDARQRLQLRGYPCGDELTREDESRLVELREVALSKGEVWLTKRCRTGFFVHLHIPVNLSRAQLQHVDTMLGIYVNQLGLLWHSLTDNLTGLFNRQAFEEKLSELYHRQQSNGLRRRQTDQRAGAGVFAMLDIDHFKTINDSFGHVYGDEVLVAVARMMQQFFRENDLLFRYGGEEFALVLFNVDIETARGILDRYRAALAGRRFPQMGQVTVSIGFTALDFDVAYRDLAQRADTALYYSKAHGRNRVSCFEQDLNTQMSPGVMAELA